MATLAMKPRILFISGREIDYIRNRVLIKALEENFEVIIATPSAGNIIIRILVGVAKFLLRLPNYDICFVGFYGQPLAIALSFLQNKPIILDAYVSTYETLCEDRQMFKPASPMGILAKWIDSYSCRIATQIITDTLTDAHYFHKTYAVPARKITPIYVGCDPAIFQPRAQDDSDTEVTQVFYYGSYLPLHGTRVIIEAAAALKERTDIRFLLGGDGPQRKDIQELVAKWQLDNVDLVAWIPFEQLPNYIARASICLGGHFSDIPKAARVISTKTFQFIAMRKATIVGDNPAVQEVFVHGKDVWAIPMNDSSALAAAVEWLTDEVDLRMHIAQGGYEVFQTNFTPLVIAHQLKRLVESAQCTSVS
jgi:glycosyltransferase involved in cell wall biosynthesis